MRSPGAGRTTTPGRAIAPLQNELRIGVMEADVDPGVDAARIAGSGARVIRLHTDGMCHLVADMTRQGVEAPGVDGLDPAILENVGHLVCPAEFDAGAEKNAMILSVPEGDDKPLKYPLIFSVCDVVPVNRTDVLPCFEFSLEQCSGYIHMRNPNAKILPICARTGEGMDARAAWLIEQVRAWRT